MNTPSTTDRTPFDSFDDAMVGELRQVVIARGAQQHRRRRPAAIVASVAAVTAAAFGISTLSTSAAFAVERTDAGDIRIAIHRLDDADSLEKELARYGIDATVDYRPSDSAPSLPVAPEGAPGSVQLDPGGDLPDGSGSLTVEGSAGASSGAAGTPGAGAPPSACGDLSNLPLTAELQGDDYVITIPNGSALTRSDSELRITTSGDVADSVAGIEVDYVIDGVDCGFGSISASAEAVPAS